MSKHAICAMHGPMTPEGRGEYYCYPCSGDDDARRKLERESNAAIAAAFAEARKRARNDVEEAHLDTSWQEIVNDSEAVDALLGDMGIAQEGT